MSSRPNRNSRATATSPARAPTSCAASTASPRRGHHTRRRSSSQRTPLNATSSPAAFGSSRNDRTARQPPATRSITHVRGTHRSSERASAASVRSLPPAWLAYVPLYAAGVTVVRSLVWNVATIGILLFVAALLL